MIISDFIDESAFDGRPTIQDHRDGKVTAQQHAERIVNALTPKGRQFVLSVEHVQQTGDFRGFAAMHDFCDANMLLPDIEAALDEPNGMQDSDWELCNAVSNEVNKILGV